MIEAVAFSRRRGIPVFVSRNRLIAYLTKGEESGVAIEVSNRSRVFAALNQVERETEILAPPVHI